MLLCSGLASSASAQSIGRHSVQFGIMGGIASPLGQLSDEARHDWSVGALALVGAQSSRLKVRVDGQVQQLAGTYAPGGNHPLCLGCDGPPPGQLQRYRVFDVTANAVYDLIPTAPASFYVICGGGVYHERQSDVGGVTNNTATRFGVNVGAGVSFRVFKLRPFVEARYHNVIGAHSVNFGPEGTGATSSFQFVPLNVGVVF